MIDNVLKRIKKLPEGDKRKFFRALKYSVHGDGDTPPKVYSPSEIEDTTDIPIPMLYNYGIITDKRKAIEFLESLNYDVSISGFRKRTTEKKYKRTFSTRKTHKFGNKLVFTYLEILVLEDLRITPELPEEL